MAIGYLGPEGTFTHSAARELCPGADLIPVPTQGQAIEQVEAGLLDGAVVPVDNSVNGVVLPTWDALLGTTQSKIIADTLTPVTFNAYTLTPDEAPTAVVSHPHALAQCAGYVASLGVPTRTASSTAEACANLAPGEVAIAAPVCAELYPVTTIAEKVEDGAGAITHFGLVSRDEPAPKAERWASVIAALPMRNAPGSLAALLAPLADLGCNLSNIVPRPLRGTADYAFLLFLTDVDRHREEQALHGLDAQCSAVSLLGRFSATKIWNTDAAPQIPARLQVARA